MSQQKNRWSLQSVSTWSSRIQTECSGKKFRQWRALTCLRRQSSIVVAAGITRTVLTCTSQAVLVLNLLAIPANPKNIKSESAEDKTDNSTRNTSVCIVCLSTVTRGLCISKSGSYGKKMQSWRVNLPTAAFAWSTSMLVSEQGITPFHAVHIPSQLHSS